MNPMMLLFGLLGTGAIRSFGGKKYNLGRQRKEDDRDDIIEDDDPTVGKSTDDDTTETNEDTPITGGTSGSGGADAPDTDGRDDGDDDAGVMDDEPVGQPPVTSNTAGSDGDGAGTGTDTDGNTPPASGAGSTGGTPTTGSTGGTGTTDSTGGMDHGTHTPADGGTATNSSGGTDTQSGTDSGTGTSSGSGMDSTGGTSTTGSTGGTGTTGSTGGMDHGTHTPPTITPPAANATQAEVDTYVAAIRAQPEAHIHGATSSKAPEHDAAMNLAPRDGATHIAVKDGNWSDPTTWYNGQVPGDDARVLIPEGITVDYGQMSDARLFTVRVDGTLDFATDTSSKMIFDTFLVSPSGHLVIGTPTNPVAPNVDVDLIVANNGPIDTNWDPMLLSRGLISHGDTTVHGAMKDSHEKVIQDPMSGDTSVTFGSAPAGWQVGDTIVIAGTHYDGYKWDHERQDVRLYPNEDETRVITDIQGNTVFFDTPLQFDHDAPRADLATSVANYTRNVSIETENADSAQVYERGHVMFMHSDDVDVRYMEFHELGRTDKSIASRDVNDFNSTSFDSNVQGRYALHLHRTGTSDINNPAILEGNAVYGSPGWGVVHHDSNAHLINNATYDTFGSGFVAETGNETGVWQDNIAIYATGVAWDNPKNTSDIDNNFDIARGGEGFWFQGRLIEAHDNVAASVNVGFAFFHRDKTGTMIEFDSQTFAYPDALWGLSNVTADDAPILSFSGNEAFAAHEGLHVVKANTQQNHDVWTHLNDFTAWSVIRGVNLEYTAHYLLTDFDLVGKTPTQFSDPQQGIYLGGNMSEVVIVNTKIDGFQTGIDLNKQFVGFNNPASDHQYTIIDTAITNSATPLANYDPSIDRVLTSDQLANLAPDLNLNPLTFSAGDEWIRISGTKTDTLGTVNFPTGLEVIDIPPWEATQVLNNYGYWTTSSGQNYTLLDIYFTDRVTGQVYYETHPVMISGNVPLGTSQNGGTWQNTPFNGTQDIVTQNGVTMAGGRVLYDPIAATPQTTTVISTTSTDPMAMTMSMTSNAMVPDSWLATEDAADTALAQPAADNGETTPNVQPLFAETPMTPEETSAEQEMSGMADTDILPAEIVDAAESWLISSENDMAIETATLSDEISDGDLLSDQEFLVHESVEDEAEEPREEDLLGEDLWDALVADHGILDDEAWTRHDDDEEEIGIADAA